MGRASWDSSAYTSYTSTIADKPAAAVFTKSSLDDSLNPLLVGIRESRDSDINPNSTPIIIGVDVTGSMGQLADQIVRSGLGIIMDDIYDHKPINDPHLMCMAIGDAECDRAPLQVTQFEADAILAKQIEKFYIEKGGGANRGESYPLAWYYAAFKTVCDSMVKRKKKGYLFTIGDEAPLPFVTKFSIKSFIGDDVEENFSAHDLYEIASKNWEIFHIVIKPVSSQPVVEQWTDLVGQRLIRVDNFEALPEVIASAIRVSEGASVDDVVKSWSGSTAVAVRDAVSSLAKTSEEASTAAVVSL